jgi:hypothetical protein
MKHLFSVLALGAMLTVSTFAIPTSASAYSVHFKNRVMEPVLISSISPADTDAQELLQMLGVTLSPTDATWSEANFVAMVTKYKSIKSRLVTIVTEGGDLALEALDIADLAGKVNNEQFSQFAMTESERAELNAVREELKVTLEEIERNPDQLLELIESFTNGFADGFEGFDSTYDDYQDYTLYAYGYSDPYEPANAGQLVWLYEDSYNSMDSNVTVSWTQVDGPEVNWVNTTCATCRAFIAPSVDGEEYDYLTFELTVDNGYETDSTYVYVYVNTAENAIAELYYEVMGMDADELTLEYWQALWDYGFTLEQLREQFVLLRSHLDAVNEV